MKKIISTLLSLLLLTTPLFVFAEDFSEEAQFNPNFIISDEELQAQSMTRADIQAFLDDKGGYIAGLRTEDEDGVMRKAADIIYRAAQKHQINPKYIIVKLQKEQSLVTAKNPTQKQLDGATGYGISDGCGWECDTYKRNKGFGKQVSAAAGIMRWYYDNKDKQSFIRRAGETYTISGQEVTPRTDATAFLYTYTPHILGNKNFWILWNEWFEQVYPDGTLMKADNAPDVYLIDDGRKRKIESMSALLTRFDPNMIITVPSSELSRYDVGAPISFPNYSILKKGSTYYLLDFDTLRPFKDEDVFRQYGYNPQEVIEVSSSDIRDYEIGSTLNEPGENPRGRLIRASENNTLYFIKDGTYSPIFDDQIAALSLPGLREQPGSVSDLAEYQEIDPMLFPDATILGIEGSNKIYIIEKGKKRHIFNEKVFVGLGYKWENIIWSNQMMSIAHQTGQPLYLRDDTPIAVQEKTVVIQPEKDYEEEAAEKVDKEPTIADLMLRADTTETIGPVFETDVDTYLIADADTLEILAGKNIDQVRTLASLTKVLTAMTLFEEGLNEREIIKYNTSQHKSLYHRFRIADGEMVRADDLMDAFLVSSLNTPGRMLAQSISTEANIVAAMNETVDDLGATDTNIVGVSGVEVENYSTARDYLAIFSAALDDPEVLPYLARKAYEYDEVLDLDGSPTHFDTHSNKLQNRSDLSFTVEASKTGYLYESGANLAMLVTRKSDGKQFIVITMGNVDHANRFNEPEAITNWALDEF